ncbi:MAG: tRNA (adenosine(37)-N6)-threonylcarbamoyltransferase complex ATPase subunit type 1 TsaE [Cytophagales bacterium]|nr:tRNA (adenosine(37)-N6)-threonylcarbamoyltransferase complex ATPase subunit type 1 TsaE [Cytophagales bacterium]
MPEQVAFYKRACDEPELVTIAEAALEQAKGTKVWVLEGELGAGKTSLVKVLGQLLDWEDAVSSPSYALINEYGRGPERFYHFDFYRLNHLEEALDLGVEEYLDSGSYCFIEWAERIRGLLPDRYFLIQITIEDEGCRLFTLSHMGT